MYQDVDNHAIHGKHGAFDLYEKTMIQVTSTHHQMMRPGHDATIIAIADESTYKEGMCHGQPARYLQGRNEDIEVLTYPNAVLCFQPHPELHGADSTKAYFFMLLQRELGLAA